MPTPLKLPDDTTLRRMRRSGMTLKAIADEFGATPSAVWHRLNRIGAVPESRTVDEMTGWAIDARHRNTGVMRHMMTFNRMELGKEVSADKKQALLDWVQDMNGAKVVLDYHAEAPPNDASRTGGFFYRARLPEDEHFFRRHEPEEEES